MYHVRLYAHRPPCVMQRPSKQAEMHARIMPYHPHGYYKRLKPDSSPHPPTSEAPQHSPPTASKEGSPGSSAVAWKQHHQQKWHQHDIHTLSIPITPIPSTGGGDSHLSIPPITPGSLTHHRRARERCRESYAAVSDCGCHADGRTAWTGALGVESQGLY